MKKAVIVCGPTASGKTMYAHNLAKLYDGEVVNIDSMQVYKQIPLITASPSDQLKSELQYHLYNFKDVKETFSVAEYCSLAAKTIRTISDSKKLPIIVGGTGMYISALTKGFNEIPEISPEIRSFVRNQTNSYQELEELDPAAAATIFPGDSQRTKRALEVFLQTNKSILDFQKAPPVQPLPEFEFTVILLLPSRDFLYKSCDERLIELFANGAIEEVASIEEFGTLAAKALGISQITSYLKGQITISEAIETASAKTRQYAKRQTTWFNHQINPTKILTFSDTEGYYKLLTTIKL